MASSFHTGVNLFSGLHLKLLGIIWFLRYSNCSYENIDILEKQNIELPIRDFMGVIRELLTRVSSLKPKDSGQGSVT